VFRSIEFLFVGLFRFPPAKSPLRRSMLAIVVIHDPTTRLNRNDIQPQNQAKI
jgi:hypothetical protein